MDCNILNNYRPVSNLTFLSKVIEKAVAFYLNKYLINNNLNESLQSAYKSGHSTETALVRVKNDIKPVILVLLDLSAAFDTVDHNVLFSRLKDMFGLSGRVLEWFISYLEQAPRECLFMVFYLTIRFCYLVYHGVLFLVLWFSQCILVLLGSLSIDMELHSTCMLMTHSCIYHWMLTMSYIYTLP